MEPSKPSWGIVSTVCEPAALLVAFAAHHLELGAARVHLYLDQPNPGLRALIGHDPRVVLVDAGPEHYRRALGRRRPQGINRRQIVNANHAAATSDVDWLFHLDADEFLTGADPAAELAAVPAGTLGFRVQNGERVFVAGGPEASVFDGAMVMPVPRPGQLRKLRGGDMARYTMHGLMGHVLGKSALRLGHGAEIGIHAARLPPGSAHRASRLRLCHFDGMTRLHWVSKMLRHIDNRMIYDGARGRSDYRTRQLVALRMLGGDMAAALAFHDRLRVIGPRLAWKLRRRGILCETGVAPEAAIARQYPTLAAAMTEALGVARFDADLLAHQPQLAPPGQRAVA